MTRFPVNGDPSLTLNFHRPCLFPTAHIDHQGKGRKRNPYHEMDTPYDKLYRHRYSHPGDKSGGVRCDQTIALSGVKSVRDYPQPLRRIRYHDVQNSKTFNCLTNNFSIPAQTVADSDTPLPE